MTNKSSAASPQIEADRCLLQFSSYDDYLDALVIPQDECLLGSTEVCRTIAELGYRSSGETMSREQFEKRLAAVYAYLHPSFKPGELSSDGLISEDNLQQDLALREKSNRVGFLSTIVFLKYFNKAGCEISGYIDYADKLTKEDWKPFFKGKKKILLKKTDLGYYNWRSGKVVSNNSLNYKAPQSSPSLTPRFTMSDYLVVRKILQVKRKKVFRNVRSILLVILSGLLFLAASAPAPGFLHGGYDLPAATSYSSRFDIHSAPIVKTYAAPIVAAPILTKTVVAAPAIGYHSAPLVSSYGYGLGHSLGHGLDHGYGDYGLGHGLGHGYGGLGYGGLGYGYGHGW